MLRVDSAGIGDVILGYTLSVDAIEVVRRVHTSLRVDSKALSNLGYPLRPKGTFGICIMISGIRMQRHATYRCMPLCLLRHPCLSAAAQ